MSWRGGSGVLSPLVKTMRPLERAQPPLVAKGREREGMLQPIKEECCCRMLSNRFYCLLSPINFFLVV